MNNLLKNVFVVLCVYCALNFYSPSLLAFKSGPYIGAGFGAEDFHSNCTFSNSAPALSYEGYSDVGCEIFGGYLFPCSNTPFLIGCEGYFTNNLDLHNLALAFTLLPAFFYIDSFERNYNAGLLFKGGIVMCENYFIYGLVGPDIGSFTCTQTVSSPEGRFQESIDQALMGVRFGAGIERDFSSYFRIGFQADCTCYPDTTFSAPTLANSEDLTSSFTSTAFNIGLRLSVPL